MSEQRSVVYSLHLRGSDLPEELCFQQLCYSLETLRSKNKRLKVYVFASSAKPVDLSMLDLYDVEVARFDNKPGVGYPSSFVKDGFYEFLDHRWKHALKVAALGGCVLFVDSDTVFKQDPELLFDKYSDRSVLWAREDTTTHILHDLALLENGMNDGQFLLSSEVAAKLGPGFDVEHKATVNELLALGEVVLTPADYTHLNWLVVQYAVKLMLERRGLELQSFSVDDVALATEVFYHPNGVLHHYFSGNSYRFLPQRFWPKHRVKEYLAKGK